MIHQVLRMSCFQEFDQRFMDVALVKLGVADDGDHAAGLGALAHEPFELNIVLHQAGEGGHRHAEPDRAGRKIDIVCILGARRIGLRAAESAEALQPLARLIAEQILDGVEHWAGVRLDGDAILRSQHVEIERRHDRGDRRARSLMPADLEAVAILAQVVGIVDHPGREPQHLLFEGAQQRKPGLPHRHPDVTRRIPVGHHPIL